MHSGHVHDRTLLRVDEFVEGGRYLNWVKPDGRRAKVGVVGHLRVGTIDYRILRDGPGWVYPHGRSCHVPKLDSMGECSVDLSLQRDNVSDDSGSPETPGHLVDADHR